MAVGLPGVLWLWKIHLGDGTSRATIMRDTRPPEFSRQIHSVQRGRARVLTATSLVLGLLSSPAAQIRWASSANRLHLIGPGSGTLSDLKAAQDQAPLVQVSPGVWHLGAILIVEEGAQLVLRSTRLGGDVDRLRLRSNNSADTNRFVFISADWGSIRIEGVSITSWDDAVAGPDTEFATYGRAYIGVRSRLAEDGVTPLESRMDIVDSDVGYLGYDGSETYGLTWKVVGAHPDPTKSIYDYVNVYGDILNSRLHHNYFGAYTFGHQGGRWATNEVDHNVGYGFDLHDDSDDVVIENDQVHHNGWDGIIASERCDHLTIRGNTSRVNGQNGILLHRSSNDCVVENNDCRGNGTAGMALTGDWRCIVRSNLLAGNVEAGLRLNLGSTDNLIQGNQCASNSSYGLFLYKGRDDPEPGDDGRPKRNRFVNNLVVANRLEGINLTDSDDNTFATNTFVMNDDTLRFERAFRNRLDGNSIPENTIVKTLGSPFDAPVTYINNQPVLRVQVDIYSSTVFEDAAGRIFAPEEKGVVTSVTPAGSRLRLTAAEIGTTSTVSARSLWGRVTQGTALIDPSNWTNLSGSARQWVTQAGSPAQSLTYAVGDLNAHRSYIVRKAGMDLLTLDADATGKITFTDVAGTTNQVAYSVEAGSQVTLEKRLMEGFVVSWTSGKLQSATRLSPPDWQDVPTTNGQFSIRINPAEPMRFFRTSDP